MAVLGVPDFKIFQGSIPRTPIEAGAYQRSATSLPWVSRKWRPEPLKTETHKSTLNNRHSSHHNWVAPCKPALNDDFVAIFQVAPNRLKFGMSTLFVLKNVPVLFYQECRNIWTQFCQIQHPPSLSVRPGNNVEFRSLRAETLCMCLLRYWREIEGGRCKRGGGELSRMCSKHCFPACGKKTQGHFWKKKTVDMPNFSRFGATWKIATKSSFRTGLHGALQLLSPDASLAEVKKCVFFERFENILRGLPFRDLENGDPQEYAPRFTQFWG